MSKEKEGSRHCGCQAALCRGKRLPSDLPRQNAECSACFPLFGKALPWKKKVPGGTTGTPWAPAVCELWKAGLPEKRNPDDTLSGKMCRILRGTAPICGHKGIFPKTVQHMIICTSHLRPGIFGQDIIIRTGSHQQFPPGSIEGMQGILRVCLIQIRSSIF